MITAKEKPVDRHVSFYRARGENGTAMFDPSAIRRAGEYVDNIIYKDERGIEHKYSFSFDGKAYIAPKEVMERNSLDGIGIASDYGEIFGCVKIEKKGISLHSRDPRKLRLKRKLFDLLEEEEITSGDQLIVYGGIVPIVLQVKSVSRNWLKRLLRV